MYIGFHKKVIGENGTAAKDGSADLAYCGGHNPNAMRQLIDSERHRRRGCGYVSYHSLDHAFCGPYDLI